MLAIITIFTLSLTIKVNYIAYPTQNAFIVSEKYIIEGICKNTNTVHAYINATINSTQYIYYNNTIIHTNHTDFCNIILSKSEPTLPIWNKLHFNGNKLQAMSAIVVVNYSKPEHLQAASLLNTLMSEHFMGYDYYLMDINTQFNECISFEVYRRHLPTIFVVDDAGYYYNGYLRFTTNTNNLTMVKDFLKMVSADELSPQKRGFKYFYLKYLSITYIYNNFHIMFNYILGAFSIFMIALICIFERKIMKIMVRPSQKKVENKKKIE